MRKHRYSPGGYAEAAEELMRTIVREQEADMIQLTENDLANTQPHDQHTVEAEYADGSFCVYATHPQASAQVAAALLAQGAIRAWINGEPAGKTVIDADDPGDFEQLRRDYNE